MPEARKLVYRLGGVVTLVALLAAITWLALPYIVRTVIQSLAERSGLESVIVDIESVGWDQVTIGTLAFAVKTQAGPIVVNLSGSTARYQPTAMALTAINAESASVRWRQETPKSPAPDGTAIQRLPPLPPIRVKHMEISLESQWGHGKFSGQFDLTSPTDKVIVRLSDERQSLELTTDPELLYVAVTLTSNGEPVANLQADHPLATITTIDVSTQLHRLRNWSRGNLLVPEQVRAVLQQLGMDHGSLNVKGRLMQTADKFEFAGQGQSSWRGWRQQGMVLGGHVDFSADLNDDQWRLTALPGTRLALTEVRWGDQTASISIPKAEFDVAAEIRLEGETDTRVFIDSFTATSSALEIFLDPDTLVRARHLQLTGTVAPSGDHNRVELRALASPALLPAWNMTAETLQADAVFETDRQIRADGTFSAVGVRMRDWPKVMNAFSLTGRFAHRDHEITARGEAQLGTKRIGNWRVEPTTPTVTQLQATAEIEAATLWAFVAPLFDKSWKGLSFTSGTLSGEAQLAWNGVTASTMTLRGGGIIGRYEDTVFEDLAVEVVSRDLLSGDYNIRLDIERAKLAGDISISDAVLDFHWLNDTVELAAARMHVLGGEFAVQPSVVTLSSEEQRLAVNVAGLDFGQVLATLDQPGLSGSGRLAGSIPISVVGDGIAIKDAELSSTGSGTLRYNPGGNAATAVDNIALQALQDFRYNTMEMRINYDADGAYHVRLRLEGNNPALYNGYPIAFNLNISGELPGLLRTGILSGDFSKQILKDIQSGR